MTTKTAPKSNTFNKQKNNFALVLRFFCIFLSRRCTINTWNCLITRLDEGVNSKNNFLTLSLKYGKKFIKIWQNEWHGIRAMNFETAWRRHRRRRCRCRCLSLLTLTKLFIIIHSIYLTPAALPKSPSRLATANGPRTPFQTAKATGVIYSVPEPTMTPPPPAPRSTFKATPPKGIRGSTVSKNGRSPTQDASRREQSPGEQNLDSRQSPVSPSRLLR